MSLYKLTPDDFEYFTLETHPKKAYSSGSQGITGSAYVYARRSNFVKDILDSEVLSDIYYDNSLENIRSMAVFSTSSNVEDTMESYLTAVRGKSVASRIGKKKNIFRFVPPYDFNFEFAAKSVVRNHLMPYYRVSYPTANYSFTNYNCLNFHTSSNTPEDAVLLYPNVRSGSSGSEYQISGAFAFDFWVKPKYTVEEGVEYKAGSIMHLSGAYCLSLHTGSSVDQNGRPDRFRVALQLREDADVLPSLIDLNLTSSAGGFTIATTDNSLPINKWSHVTFTWRGFESPSYGSGSIFLNGELDSKFNIDDDLIVGDYIGGDPSVLCVGNYYEGENTGTSALDRFFGNDTAEREGLYELNSGTGFFAPDVFEFTHPLNAEIHDLKLYNRNVPKVESQYLMENGPSGSWGLRFYLPPFFTEESPFRKDHGGFGGVLVSPFFTKDQSTSTPFASELAFSCGGAYINLENYVRDFATGNYARLWALTGSAFVPPSSTELSANDFLFATGSNIKRQYLVLPSDNGSFNPDFSFLQKLSDNRFRNDLGNVEWGAVSLNNIVSESQYRASKAITTSGSILDDVLGASDTDITAIPGSSLAIAHRTQDTSSNFVVLFDVSNLFYGMKIRPKSLVIRDTQMTYTDFGFVIRDDGKGNLYRADQDGPHPTWASIGNVFYDEGMIIIKSPMLYFFGQNGFEIEFEGTQNIHVMTVNAMAQSMMQTSSSNPSFMEQPSDDLANNEDKDFVYITGINVHDDNLNVITRTHIAQPVVKRTGDKILFKVKMDF